MNRTIRAAVCAVAVAGLTLGLSACSEAVDAVDKATNATYEVTYEVSGKGVDSIDFHSGGGSATNPTIETVQKPALPWTKTVTLRGIMPPAVMPLAADLTGSEVSCKITYKGKVIKEESGEGLAAAAGCIAVSPIVG
ncbi:MmpS family transport accessory protein [Streptomyces sp. NPDC052236]|uniref:MmpS family transport accessory protein n=1 Tax=Streptomyces sp. NPDC052236 TaxID=3365686 RepID=UPI0037D5E037